MTFHDLLAKYRAVSFSERDKGDRFERLIGATLHNSCEMGAWFLGGKERQLYLDKGMTTIEYI